MTFLVLSLTWLQVAPVSADELYKPVPACGVMAAYSLLQCYGVSKDKSPVEVEGVFRKNLETEADLSQLSMADCLATISFPCGRQLEVPVDGAPLEYLSSIFAQRQLEFPGTGRLLIIVTPDFHGGCDGRGWTRQGTSAVARDGQNSGRFGKDGGNERENGTQVSR